LLIALSLIGGSRAVAQGGVPSTALTRPEAEFPDGFSSIRGFRELSDGRVLVSDQRERKVVLIDFAGRSATPVSRPGQGPEEYNVNLELHPWRGDTTYLSDIERRFLVITPGGGTAGTIRYPQRLGSISGIDRTGRVYISPFFVSANGQPADSAPLLRADLRSGRLDTLLFRQPPPRRDPNAPVNPYSPRDLWAPLPDGRLAFLDVDEYRVSFRELDGRITQGPPIPWERIPVVERDREEHAALLRRNSGIGIARAGAAGTPLPPLREAWPTHKPPFVGNALLVAPNGDLWVQRTIPAGSRTPVYDVIDGGSGRLLRKVMLPPDTKVIGLGARSVYLARFDDVDLMYVQRYAMP
jgi:hypothetical protein